MRWLWLAVSLALVGLVTVLAVGLFAGLAKAA